MASALDMVAGAGQYGFDPLGDIYEGRKTRFATQEMNRADQARPLMGQALQGDSNALNSLAGIDPQGFMEVSGFQDKRAKSKAEQAAAQAERVAGALYRADTPEKWAATIEYLKRTDHDVAPEEEDFANRDAVLAEYMTLKDQMAQSNSDRTYNLEVQKANQPKASSGYTLSEGQVRYGPNGEVLAAGPPKTVQPRALTSVDKNAILEADNQVQAGTNVIDMLNRALEINDTAGSGALAGTQAFVARNDPTGFFDDKKGAATTEFNNIVLNQALSSMKSIFGGNPTEGERAVLIQLQGAADKSPVERKAIIERGIELAQRRVAFNKERAEEIRGGSYFGGASTVQPSGAPQGGPAPITEADIPQATADAQEAIAAGADPQAVLQELIQSGVDPAFAESIVSGQ